MKAPPKPMLSNELMLQILDNLPTSIFVKDENLKYIYSNKLHRQMVGKEEEELLGFSDSDFYGEAGSEELVANDRRVIHGGVMVISDEMVARKDGVTMPVLTRKARLRSNEGKLYLLGTNSDFTEVKKREEQYRALAETVPVGVLQIEEDGRVSFANPLMLAYFRRDSTTLTWAEVCVAVGKSPEVFPGQASRFECDLAHPNGAPRHVLVISSGWLTLAKGRRRSALVSVVDVTENAELKRINEEILRLNQELALNMQKLKDAQNALVKKGQMEQMGQLTATIAHELRNPLGAVRTSIFLMERKLKDKGMGVESQMLRINNGVTRCDNIITQLLDFSRSKQLECKADDLDAWLEALIEEEAKRLPAVVNLECVLGLDGRLVPFDASRLQRAIVNLLSNASEAMVGNGDKPLSAGAAEPHILIGTKLVGGMVEISVTDNGPGMAPELLEKIREPLFTTKSFGTGLGVPAVEQIASQHGGTLSIVSGPGQGASFTLHLPATIKEEEAA
jgi:PAS domain S-box-containing protein